MDRLIDREKGMILTEIHRLYCLGKRNYNIFQVHVITFGSGSSRYFLSDYTVHKNIRKGEVHLVGKIDKQIPQYI